MDKVWIDGMCVVGCGTTHAHTQRERKQERRDTIIEQNESSDVASMLLIIYNTCMYANGNEKIWLNNISS